MDLISDSKNEIVLFGRREVLKSNFIKAVAESNSTTNVCKYLGFNPKPQTTRDRVEALIKELNLDISHFRYRYNKGDAFIASVEQKIKNYEGISSNNRIYFDSFLDSVAPNSRSNYKCLIGNFLETIGDQDFCCIEYQQIVDYAQDKASIATQRNAVSYNRAALIYCISNNVNDAVSKVSKELLINLISNTAKK